MSCCLFECSLRFPEAENKHTADDEPLLDYEKTKEGRRVLCSVSLTKLYLRIRRFLIWSWNNKRSRRCRKITFITLMTLVLVAFLVLYVVLPLIFMNSIQFQQSVIFNPTRADHQAFNVKPPNDADDLNVTKNIYINVNKNISLGTWQIEYRSENYYDNWSYRNNAGTIRIVLYFHQETGDRRLYKQRFRNIRQFFRIITFDYRSFGDSSMAELNEEGLVQDAVAMYKWILTQTNTDIYVWGDSIGSSIATHMIAQLSKENIKPAGLILENPFTSLSEEITQWYWPLAKIFSWMPWYKVTITDPLEINGLSFKTKNYVLQVKCPIMIIKWRHSTSYHLADEIVSLLTHDASFHSQVVLVSFPWYCYLFSGYSDCFYYTRDALKDFLHDSKKNSTGN